MSGERTKYCPNCGAMIDMAVYHISREFDQIDTTQLTTLKDTSS